MIRPYASTDDPYVDPVTGVLKNRLGLTDAEALEKAEASFAAVRSGELAQTPLPGNFDLAHMQAIHRYLFGDVYAWAGALRTVNISKGNSTFAFHEHVGRAAAALFGQLAHEQCLAGYDPAAFSVRAGYYLGELNALHPFREGNGRTQREFISHLAQKNGYYIAWEQVKQVQMLDACIHSFVSGDASQLTQLILGNLQPATLGHTLAMEQAGGEATAAQALAEERRRWEEAYYRSLEQEEELRLSQ